MVRHRLQKQLSAAQPRHSLIHLGQPSLTASPGQQEPHAGCCLVISSHGSYPLQIASPPGMSSFFLRRQFFPNPSGEVLREILVIQSTSGQPSEIRTIRGTLCQQLQLQIMHARSETKISFWHQRFAPNLKQVTSKQRCAYFAVMMRLPHQMILHFKRSRTNIQDQPLIDEHPSTRPAT